MQRPTRRKPLIDPLFGLFMASLLSLVTDPAHSADRTDFDIQGYGTIEWVSDGDTARVRVHDYQNWKTLRAEAFAAQKRYQRDLKVHQRFKRNGNTVNMLVRIGMIDTAESQHPIESRNTLAGVRASDYAKRTFRGNVSYRCWTIGYYGRPICSVSTSQGDWGKHMIGVGFSKYETEYGRHPFDHQNYLSVHNDTYR